MSFIKKVKILFGVKDVVVANVNKPLYRKLLRERDTEGHKLSNFLRALIYERSLIFIRYNPLGMEGIFLILTVTYIILFLKLYSYMCTMEWLRIGEQLLKQFQF